MTKFQLRGHLTRESLEQVLGAVRLPVGSGPVVVDCLEMTGYDLEARHAFVEWNRKNGGRISRVAIVTDNRVWWMVIAAMSLASGRDMKGFAKSEDAVAWATKAG